MAFDATIGHNYGICGEKGNLVRGWDFSTYLPVNMPDRMPFWQLR